MRIMGIDYGDSRTGLALSDASEFLASPLCVIHEKNFELCAQKVAEQIHQHHVEFLVVGYPKNMNNTIGERAELCQTFAELLHALTGIDYILWDERGSTVSAHQYLNVTNTRGKKRKAVVDAVAAVIILESYLGYRKNQGKA